MMNMKKLTFNEFCHINCDGLYDPRFEDENQCTGYIQLKKMVVENIEPYSIDEIKRWETNPNVQELYSIPDIRYLRFLHVLLRPYIIDNWKLIKNMVV